VFYIFEILLAIGIQVRRFYSLKTPSVIYFSNPLSNCDSSERVSKFFKEVGLANSERKLHP